MDASYDSETTVSSARKTKEVGELGSTIQDRNYLGECWGGQEAVAWWDLRSWRGQC